MISDGGGDGDGRVGTAVVGAGAGETASSKHNLKQQLYSLSTFFTTSPLLISPLTSSSGLTSFSLTHPLTFSFSPLSSPLIVRSMD